MDDIEALTTDLEGVPVAAILSDLGTGRALSANGAAASLLATPADDLIGSEVVAYVHGEERDAATNGVAALADGVVDAFQVRNRRIVRADGTVAAVDISGRRFESDHDRLALWLLTPIDVELEVTHAERSVERLLVVTDHDWQLEYVSADAHLLYGSGQALVGTPLLGFVHPSVAIEFLEAASRAVKDRIAVSVSTRLRTEDGAWTYRDCLVVPMCDHEPPRLGIVISDNPSVERATTPEVIAAHVQHTAIHARAVDALDTLAALSSRQDFPDLSARQIEILTRAIRGESVDRIAAALHLSSSTVRNHLSGIYRKFGVHSRSDLLAELLRTSSVLGGNPRSTAE